MRYRDLHRVRKLFAEMQVLRIELMGDAHDKTAMRMAAMINKGHEAMKEDFTKITTDGKFDKP